MLEGLELAPPWERSEVRLVGPDHLQRTSQAPPVLVDGVPLHARRFTVVIARGAASAERTAHPVRVVARTRGRVELYLAATSIWSAMTPNVGYWWTVGYRTSQGELRVLSSRTRCIVRSEPIERVVGSTLRYPDAADVPAEIRQRSLHHRPVDVAAVPS